MKSHLSGVTISSKSETIETFDDLIRILGKEINITNWENDFDLIDNCFENGAKVCNNEKFRKIVEHRLEEGLYSIKFKLKPKVCCSFCFHFPVLLTYMSFVLLCFGNKYIVSIFCFVGIGRRDREKSR